MELRYRSEFWPLAAIFTISRGSKTKSEVIVVECLENGQVLARGEGVPYSHYGETSDECLQQIASLKNKIEKGLSRQELLELLPAGAARNAIDCALWDFEAKTKGKAVWELAKLEEPKPIHTAFTISYKSALEMGEEAKKNAHRPILKLKLAKREDLQCIEAVRVNAPNALIMVDANEGWTFDTLEELMPSLQKLRVSLIEQPLPASLDQMLEIKKFPIPLCADESCRSIESLPALAKRYSYINLKLDKTGGLTHAIQYIEEAKKHNLRLMIGCMVATSLSMAPAMLLTPYADYVDLDGPILLEKDRENGLLYEDSIVYPPLPSFWG